MTALLCLNTTENIMYYVVCSNNYMYVSLWRDAAV